MWLFTGGVDGHMINQIHDIQQNVPVEKVEATFEAAWEWGK
jgi:uroporphyrinogen-III decarboxylase